MVTTTEGEAPPVPTRAAQVRAAIVKPVATQRDRTTVALVAAAMFTGLIGPLGGVVAALLVFVASTARR